VNDLTFTDPCLLFPLHREAVSFYREFRPQQRFPGAPCRARFCGPAWLTVLVVETGIGLPPTEKALDWLLSKPVLDNVPYQPKLVLSAGFCGALQDGFNVGDILLATEIADAAGNRWPATWPGELPAGEWRPPLHRGRLLTSTHLVGWPEEKLALGKQHDALAVDMESAAVACLCSKHGIPFGCVRAVSDRVDTPLSPALASLLSQGRVSVFALAGTLLRSPGLTPEMWRLAKQTRFAAEQLAVALGELLTLTLPWTADD
jgi:adenosylhomocysteine nucleosidase